MTTDQKAAFARTFPVHVGVDTGKRFHVLVARGPDGQRRKPVKVLVSREGFERADAELQALFPGVERSRMLIGLEFAGHHGFTFAHFLASHGQRRGLYRSYYEALLARNGGLKTKAVCAIARKLVPLLLAVLQRGQAFDRQRWEAARHQPALTQ